MSWAKEAMQFAMATLPNLLTKHGEHNVDLAFKELGEEFSKKRVEQLRSRKSEIDKNRSEIDAELARRGAAESPSPSPAPSLQPAEGSTTESKGGKGK